MKNFFLLLSVCLVWGIPPALGQRVQISASQYFEVIGPANNSSRFPIRRIRTEELFEKGKLIRTVVEKFEVTATASRATIVETERGVEKTLDQIELGDFLYTRSGRGDWLKQPWFFQHPSSEVTKEFFDTFTYWKETNIVDSVELTVYHQSVMIMLNKTSKGFCDNDYYFGPEDKFLKRVTTYRTQDDPSIVTRRITYTSEYDPNIKIEAPIK